MDSILNSIKKLLGIDEAYTHFDADIIMGINTALSILTQIGVGPSTGFSIADNTAIWTSFVPDMSKLELIKSYVHLKTKLLFDPPASSTIVEVYNRQLTELEWRISALVDPGEEVII